MQRGYAVPIVLLLLGLIGVVSLSFWVISNNVNFSSSKDDVKGASVKIVERKPGLGVYVTSTSGTWELSEYLCTTYDECAASLTSGKLWSTVGGGKASAFEVAVAYDKSWTNYKYIKFFVKNLWEAGADTFKATDMQELDGSEIVTLKDARVSYDVAIFPLEKMQSGFYRAVGFSN